MDDTGKLILAHLRNLETDPARQALAAAAPLIRRVGLETGDDGFSGFADNIEMVVTQAPALGPLSTLAARALEIQLDDLRMAAVIILKAAVGLCTPHEAESMIAETTTGKMLRFIDPDLSD